MSKRILTQNYLKELFRYNPKTGVFIRLISRSIRVKVKDTVGTVHFNKNKSCKYLRTKIDGNSYLMHRLAWLYMQGSWPIEEIDHIDGNGANNRWDNLREVETDDNLKNKAIYRNNKSGCCGVSMRKSNSKWAANIKVERKQVHLGYFNCWFEAVCARKSAENKHGYHANHGRQSSL